MKRKSFCRKSGKAKNKKDRNPNIHKDSGFSNKNRSDRIRTCDLYVPNVALYQAEPHSDKIGNLLIQIPDYGKGT